MVFFHPCKSCCSQMSPMYSATFDLSPLLPCSRDFTTVSQDFLNSLIVSSWHWVSVVLHWANATASVIHFCSTPESVVATASGFIFPNCLPRRKLVPRAYDRVPAVMAKDAMRKTLAMCDILLFASITAMKNF